MSKHAYPLELLYEDLKLLQGNVDRYNPANNYYEDDDLPRWKKQITELKEAIAVLDSD